MLAPRRSDPLAVAKAYIPVVLVSAETEPIRVDATNAWANDTDAASRALAAASPAPAAAKAKAGGTAAAIRPAGRSITSRPTPNAVVRSPISPTVSDRSAPISGSSGMRENAAAEIANTIPPTRIGETRSGRDRAPC